MNPDTLLIALRKGHERYVLLLDDTDAMATAALRQIGRWACNPELSFNWWDAMKLSQSVKNRQRIKRARILCEGEIR